MVKQYETRTVAHGNEWGAYATFEITDGVITFDDPTVLTGMRASSFETSQDSKAYYADNQEHVRLQGAKSTEGSITFYQILKQFMLDCLGKSEQPNGMITDSNKKKNFVFQYQKTITDEFGNEKPELHIFYNVQAGAMKTDSSTDEDSTEPQEFELPVTASPNNYVKDSEGNSITEAVIPYNETTAPLFDMAYNQVILPTTVAETPPTEPDPET